MFDPKNPEDSSVDVTIRPSGIRTSSSQLDSDLQGEKFFKSDEFPTIHFVSRKIKPEGAKLGEVYGDLTMLGVTKPANLIVHFNKADYHPITKDFVAGFSANAIVKRSDFGMAEYLPMVGDEVRLEVQTEGINVDQKKRDSMRRK
jgi:polyisoprenoid-binding protein YceI